MDCSDLEGYSSNNIVTSFHESAFWQRVGRPRKYEGLPSKRFYLISSGRNKSQKLVSRVF